MYKEEEDKDQIIRGLQNLGFTLNDSKVYFALLGLGLSNPAKIAEISNVDRPRVYDSLKRLLKKKIVEEESVKRAPRYKAISSKEVLERIQDDYQQKISLARDLEKKLEAFKTPITEPLVWSISGFTNIERAVLKLTSSANKKLSILLTPDFSSRVKSRFNDLVDFLVEKKRTNFSMEIKIAFTVTDIHDDIIKRMFAEEIKIYSWSSGTVLPFGLFLSEDSFLLTFLAETMTRIPQYTFGITMENAKAKMINGFENLIQYCFTQLCKEQVWYDETSLL